MTTNYAEYLPLWWINDKAANTLSTTLLSFIDDVGRFPATAEIYPSSLNDKEGRAEAKGELIYLLRILGLEEEAEIVELHHDEIDWFAFECFKSLLYEPHSFRTRDGLNCAIGFLWGKAIKRVDIETNARELCVTTVFNNIDYFRDWYHGPSGKLSTYERYLRDNISLATYKIRYEWRYQVDSEYRLRVGVDYVGAALRR